MTLVLLVILLTTLSILMAKIMRALPERWTLPWNDDTNPAPFYSSWGIGWLVTIVAIVGVIDWYQWFVLWVLFTFCFPALYFGFQRPTEKKTADTDAGAELNDIITRFFAVEKKILGVFAPIYKHIWKS